VKKSIDGASKQLNSCLVLMHEHGLHGEGGSFVSPRGMNRVLNWSMSFSPPHARFSGGCVCSILPPSDAEPSSHVVTQASPLGLHGSLALPATTELP
jgi:hypothetical protein